MIRVFLVDDHEIVRCGVADLVDDEDDLVVVGQASSAGEAMRRIPAVNPDIAVLDVRLPDGNGIELCRDLRSRCPDLNCLMLTSFTDEQAMLDAIMAGAGGYVIKDIKGMDLVSAIRAVGSGRSMLDNRAAAVLKSRLQAGTESSPVATLTARERTLLELIGQGLTNRQIAGEMFLSEKTVKNYVSRLLGKLGVERRTQAAVLAARLADTRTYGERPSARGANSQSVGQQDISASAKIGGWPISRAPKSR